MGVGGFFFEGGQHKLNFGRGQKKSCGEDPVKIGIFPTDKVFLNLHIQRRQMIAQIKRNPKQRINKKKR